jgi:hypothetical protein
MTAQEATMARVNQMMPLSGHPKRFSFHIETNEETTQVRHRNTIIHRLKAIIVSASCIYAVLKSVTDGWLTQVLCNFVRP